MKVLENIFQFLYQVFTQPISLGGISVSISLIFTILVAFFAVIVGSRYVSNWLRDHLLTRLGFQEGTREAIATIFRYFTIMLAFIIVPQAAGLDLSSLAFLAGGLGIGIGFGFQGLAQNFVSGLILVFEQPVQVGDYIELGNLEGTIRKISIRSTIIVTNDGISIIVPNSDLVNHQIINWSYENMNSRIHIPVRVAYGSDPVLVTEALLAATQRESRILSYPPPQVWLRTFGEDSMNFELLVWIDKPRFRLPIQSSLNFIIHNELYSKNIRIPVSQRDLWLRNPEDLKSVFESLNFNKHGEGGDKASRINLSKDKEPLYSPENLSLRDLLKKVVYFEKFSDLELLSLIEKGYRQTYSSEQFIFHEGDPGDAFHIILSGSVEIIAEKTNKHIRDLYAGDFFGELSLLMGIRRSAGVRAKETTIVFVVNRNIFQSFLSSYPQLANQIAEKLVERKQEFIARKKELGLSDDDDLENNPLIWIRKRMRTLFHI
ncbi:mechanosensitive ion channel domain-containing protein [Limnoraphis robusta]|uniref:Mechanosensitive ion channel protein n=1 Tax=Limnoraphis robusta CS-951 TaxID=1637645 RepID=A0A0J9EX45_9CYAN|nr:mechanosensitive ion channel domain-containing protein [Limnoraphis robusta]KMW70783.1 mechanosensitive ion channel protein [Limnoraphis robusta CS-951]